MRTLVLTFLAAMLLAAALTTLADDAVKTSQPPYKPGRQLDEDNSRSSTASEPATNGDAAVKAARAPYKPGREAEEQPEPSTASRK
jgi:hypothetical protein